MNNPDRATAISREMEDAHTPARRAPAHEMVYRDLRALILFGEMAPGQAVTIQGLCEALGAGMTPVREALRRLIAEGALDFRGNRRVCVPLLSAENVRELIFIRKALEPELAMRATERARPADLDALESIDARVDAAIARGDVRAYLESNHEFHAHIAALAGSPIMASVAGGLWLRFGPLLRVVCGRVGTQNLPDGHKEAIQAMRRGDAAGAAEAIRRDIGQGMEMIRHTAEGEGDSRLD